MYKVSDALFFRLGLHKADDPRLGRRRPSPRPGAQVFCFQIVEHFSFFWLSILFCGCTFCKPRTR